MSTKKASYVVLMAPNRAGEGAAVLGRLAAAGVDLLAFTGFPAGRGRAQLDLVTGDIAGVRRVAKKNGWRLSQVKRGFVIQGKDEVGAVHRQLRKLGQAGVGVTAADAVAAGGGRFGMIVWVKPKDYARAAKLLGAS